MIYWCDIWYDVDYVLILWQYREQTFQGFWLLEKCRQLKHLVSVIFGVQ